MLVMMLLLMMRMMKTLFKSRSDDNQDDDADHRFLQLEVLETEFYQSNLLRQFFPEDAGPKQCLRTEFHKWPLFSSIHRLDAFLEEERNYRVASPLM